MTGHNDSDESTLDTLLLESGQGDAPELKQVLRELCSLASGVAPAPSAELQALLSTTSAKPTRHLSSVPTRSSESTMPGPAPRRRRRSAVISLTVVAAMGLGAGAAAAASEDFRGVAQQIISGIVQTVVQYSDPASPQPDHTGPADQTPDGPPAVAPSVVPSQNPAEQPGAPVVPPAVPGGADPSVPPSSPAPTQAQVPPLPDQAAHNLPGWLVPPLPPVVPPVVGSDGKAVPVPDPQVLLGA
ncbi:hypothetical protein ACQCSX_20640 [Pseudarthrobacter sp. P1]|uniref:hypothetical protein n=1 Tax=Pseudarthrobacter sp. P1 TaxID=3418418 RepID=UPI003CFA4D06